MRIILFVVDIAYSNLLPVNYRETYARYIFVCKIIIKEKGMIALLTNLSTDRTAVRTLDTTLPSDRCLYTLSAEKIPLIIQSTDLLVNNHHKPWLFYATAFYRHTKVLLDNVQACHLEHEKEQFLTFARRFCNQELASSTNLSLSSLSLFLSGYLTAMQEKARKVRDEG